MTETINKNETLEAVEKFVKEKSNEIWGNFDLDEKEDNFLLFITRENGDMSNDSAGETDIKNAKTIGYAVLEKFPNIKPNIDTVDEWTYLSFRI